MNQEAERVVNIVINALKEKDADAIKNLFSEYARKEDSDIDKQIEDMFNFIDGNIVSTGEILAGYSGGSTSAERGDIKTLYSGSIYDVTTDKGKTYFITIDGIYNFNWNEDKEGVYLINVLDNIASKKNLMDYDGYEVSIGDALYR